MMLKVIDRSSCASFSSSSLQGDSLRLPGTFHSEINLKPENISVYYSHESGECLIDNRVDVCEFDVECMHTCECRSVNKRNFRV